MSKLIISSPGRLPSTRCWDRTGTQRPRVGGDDATLLHIAVHPHTYLVLGDVERICGFGGGDGAAAADQVFEQVQRTGCHDAHFDTMVFR